MCRLVNSIELTSFLYLTYNYVRAASR